MLFFDIADTNGMKKSKYFNNETNSLCINIGCLDDDHGVMKESIKKGK